MKTPASKLERLIDQSGTLGSIRVAVVDAAQDLVLETLRDAEACGLVEPLMIGDAETIVEMCRNLDWQTRSGQISAAPDDVAAAKLAIELVRAGNADAVMKGNIHTDTFMHALLDKEFGLRLPGRRVSHVFVAEVPVHSKLLGITDAAINIAPDLNGKVQILENAVGLFHLLGVAMPKVAVLSAIETITPAIMSTLDAASLTLMARRGQIAGALVDGPLAFDNAISEAAAKEKGIMSEVAGDADIVVVPDLVSGNILAKNLEYLSGAVAAGVVVGLSVPVVLSSRADPPASRQAGLAIAKLMHHRTVGPAKRSPTPEVSLASAPQPEHACCPLPR